MVFWAANMWRTPLNLCIRLFKNNSNEVLAETSGNDQVSSVGSAQVDRYSHPFTYSTPHMLIESDHTLALSSRKCDSSGGNSESYACCTEIPIPLSHLVLIAEYCRGTTPIPLAFCAASPRSRIATELTSTCCTPHSITALRTNASRKYSSNSAYGAPFPPRHPYHRTIAASSVEGLGESLSFVAWWLLRPLPLSCSLAAPLRVEVIRISKRVDTSAVADTSENDLTALISHLRKIQYAPSTERNHQLPHSLFVPLNTIGLAQCFVPSVRALVAALPGWPSKVCCLNLRRCEDLHDLGPLAGLSSLQELDASHSAVRLLAGLGNSPSLRVVKLQGCKHLSSLSELGRCTKLREITASQSGVYDIEGLSRSRSLHCLRLFGCLELTDLSPLGNIPSLREVYASESGVVEVSGLRNSRSLLRLHLSYCELSDLRPLALIPTLEVLILSSSTTVSVAPMSVAPRLVYLNVSGCPSIRDLHPVGSVKTLLEVNAAGCPLREVSDLARSTHLTRLDLHSCQILTDVGILGNCPSLSWLNLSSSGVRRLHGLSTSSTLRELDVSYCISLEDLEEVVSCAHLCEARVGGCAGRQRVEDALLRTSSLPAYWRAD